MPLLRVLAADGLLVRLHHSRQAQAALVASGVRDTSVDPDNPRTLGRSRARQQSGTVELEVVEVAVLLARPAASIGIRPEI